MRIEDAKIRVPKGNKKTEINNKSRRVSIYGESYKGEYYNLAVDKLIPFESQVRKVFDEKSLNEMASTIKEPGIRQPLTVLPSELESGKYEIVSGERRWRAAKLLGLKIVPCIIIHSRATAEEIALIENIQRKNLHPLELMEGFKNLIKKGVCKTAQEIAKKLGVSRSIVSETMGLDKLPEQTKDMLISKNVKSREILRRLQKTPETHHNTIINKYAEERSESKEKIKKNIIRKTKIIDAYLKNETLVVETPNLAELTLEQKQELRQKLTEIIES